MTDARPSFFGASRAEHVGVGSVSRHHGKDPDLRRVSKRQVRISAAWNATVELFLAARAVHQAARNLSGIANQLALASREDLCVCADADSQAKYPGMPNCTLTPETWCPFGPDEKCEYTPNGTTPALHSMYDIFLN